MPFNTRTIKDLSDQAGGPLGTFGDIEKKMLNSEIADPALPEGWTAKQPTPQDIAELAELVATLRAGAAGVPTSDPTPSQSDIQNVEASTIGQGAWTRRQLVIRDATGRLVAWPVVHDRAAGRTLVNLDIHPDLQDADDLAGALIDWIHEAARQVAIIRGVDSTQLDATCVAGDTRTQEWLYQSAFEKVRTCSQMVRPVTEADKNLMPDPPRPDLRVRTIDTHEGGGPVAEDLQIVHHLIEDSFQDHFNSHRESFPEFVQRLREAPGHRWDHWWLVEIHDGQDWVPAGSMVSSILGPDGDGVEGSFVDYVGVGRHARGQGAGKAMLQRVIQDAAERGRNRVGLEVDDESPTGANELYQAMGWQTKYVTESWHKVIPVDPRNSPDMLADSVESLAEWVDYFRATVTLKISDLTPQQLCTPPLEFTTHTLQGMVRHLTEVESYWFHAIAEGETPTALYVTDDDPDYDFNGVSAETAEQDVAAFHAQVSASRDVQTKIVDWDAPLPGKRRGSEVNMRWVMSHLATEYARHCGHMDLLREALDGRTGE